MAIAIRDRVKELRRVRASELIPNSKNWRTHPKNQKDALKGLLTEIGFAGAVLARELEDGTLQLVDGHLRAETTPDMEIPVLVLDVTEAEADLLLATYDPLSAMATADEDAFRQLASALQPGSDAVKSMLASMAEESADGGSLSRPENGAASRYKEQYGVIIICESEAGQKEVFDALTGQGYNCKVVVT